ncbi:MAG: acyltransferase family protein [Massilia sp.]
MTNGKTAVPLREYAQQEEAVTLKAAAYSRAVSPGPASKPEIKWIQALRGVACILVVLCHARYALSDTPYWELAETLFRPGAAGVDLFFVISGFVMTYTTWGHGRKDAASFLVKRFTRIWPPYAVLTLAWVACFEGLQLLKSPDRLAVLAKSLGFVSVYPEAPLYFGVTFPLGWSLEFEAYFYLVFALSLLFSRLRWIALGSWLVYSVLVFPMPRRGLNLDVAVNLGYSWSYANLVTNAIVLEFLFGVAVAMIYLSPLRLRSPRLCWNLLFLSVAVAAWYCYGGFFDYHGPQKWGIAAVLLVFGCAVASKTIEIRLPAPLLWLGTISYSLYLTHMLTQQILSRLLPKFGYNVHSWGFIFLSTAAAIGAAYVFHELVEVRFSNLVRQGVDALAVRVQRLRRRSTLAVDLRVREQRMRQSGP